MDDLPDGRYLDRERVPLLQHLIDVARQRRSEVRP